MASVSIAREGIMSNLNTVQALPNAFNVHLPEEAVHKLEGVLGQRSRVEPLSIVLDLRLCNEASNHMTLFQVQQSVNFSAGL